MPGRIRHALERFVVFSLTGSVNNFSTSKFEHHNLSSPTGFPRIISFFHFHFLPFIHLNCPPLPLSPALSLSCSFNADEEIIEMSNVNLYLDMTVQFAALKVTREVYEAFHVFARDMLKELNMSESLANPPIKVEIKLEKTN